MEFLGRIITKSKNIESIPFIDITDNIGLIDDKIPTLIVGKALAESIYGKENVKVLDKRINKNTYWTFGKLERRSEYEVGIDTFKELVYSNLFKSVKYSYISVFDCDFDEIKSLITLIKYGKSNIIYMKGKHLYILNKKEVIGISLEETEYIGVIPEKIINIIKENKGNKIITEETRIPFKIMKLLNGKDFIIPYVYSLF